MFVTMLCWGSWANTQKLTNGWRFELFYWDYVFAVFGMSLVFAFTLGNDPSVTGTTLEQLWAVDSDQMVSALAGGVIFNAGNLLFLGAIALAGMAVAFPIAIGIALLMATGLNYWVKPQGSIFWLGLGVALILAAIFFDALAYRKINTTVSSWKGMMISVIAGILVGVFYPLVARSMEGDTALTPYAAMVFFCVGALMSNLFFNVYLMKKPLHGLPVNATEYFTATLKQHALGWLGGVIWCIGMMLNLIAARQAGPAIAYAFSQGATLIAALWGVFVWREFRGAQGTTPWLALMFACYLGGLFFIHKATVEDLIIDEGLPYYQIDFDTQAISSAQ